MTKTKEGEFLNVVIPKEIEGLPVTHIAADAFFQTDITSVVIPDTVHAPADMADPAFLDHFNYHTDTVIEGVYSEPLFSTPWGKEYFKPIIDEKVDEVYLALKAANSDIDWNIADAEGQARENAKYEVAKYIHSQLFGNLIISDVNYELYQTAYCLVKGRGACAGLSRSYLLLLQRAGFTPDEVQLISANGVSHALAGIQLYGQWYFVECTSELPRCFGMTYQNEWYRGTDEGMYNGYFDSSIPGIYYFAIVNFDSDEESEAALAEKYRSNYNRGDLNMDGTTDSEDYDALEAYLGGTSADFNLLNADVNYDGLINADDLAVLNDIITGATDLLSIIVPLYGEPVS